MKKNLTLLLLAGLGFGFNAQAQLTDGRTPQSLLDRSIEIPTKTIELQTLDVEQLLKDLASESKNNAIAKLASSDISFPEDGVIIVAPDGTRVWRVKIAMPQSMGLGLYFDKYHLPEGVEMFLYNENRKHVKGAYTHLENLDDKMFATGPVQGHIAYVELNIQPHVNIGDIELHINEVGSYFRGGLAELIYFSDDAIEDHSVLGMYDNVFFRESSTCMINSKCPAGEGFENQRKATVHTIIVSGDYLYTCSGTMINNLGNSTSACTPYLLTASHCEPDNFKSGSRFTSQYIVRFNYESVICANPPSAPNAKELTGVDFVSRSNYNDDLPASYIKGDFLLLKPKGSIPNAWDVVLNGWKANLPTVTVTAPNKLIGFHHPAGDIKKVSHGTKITNYELGAPGTHWNMQTEVGYAAQGSSGSGLFDHEGRLIGIASVSTGVGPGSCKTSVRGTDASSTSHDLSYSKLSYCWLNPGDPGDAANTKLKPWLDPSNTGAMTANPVTSNCTPLATTSNDKVDPFTATLNVFPNPSQDGFFDMNISIVNPADYSIEVYDITGKVILSKIYENMSSQIIRLDLSFATNGIYMVKLSNEFGSVTNKVSVSK